MSLLLTVSYCCSCQPEPEWISLGGQSAGHVASSRLETVKYAAQHTSSKGLARKRPFLPTFRCFTYHRHTLTHATTTSARAQPEYNTQVEHAAQQQFSI